MLNMTTQEIEINSRLAGNNISSVKKDFNEEESKRVLIYYQMPMSYSDILSEEVYLCGNRHLTLSPNHIGICDFCSIVGSSKKVIKSLLENIFGITNREFSQQLLTVFCYETLYDTDILLDRSRLSFVRIMPETTQVILGII